MNNKNIVDSVDQWFGKDLNWRPFSVGTTEQSESCERSSDGG